MASSARASCHSQFKFPRDSTNRVIVTVTDRDLDNKFLLLVHRLPSPSFVSLIASESLLHPPSTLSQLYCFICYLYYVVFTSNHPIVLDFLQTLFLLRRVACI